MNLFCDFFFQHNSDYNAMRTQSWRGPKTRKHFIVESVINFLSCNHAVIFCHDQSVLRLVDFFGPRVSIIFWNTQKLKKNFYGDTHSTLHCSNEGFTMKKFCFQSGFRWGFIK